MDWIKHTLRLVIALLLQVLLINNLQILGVCQPFIYIVFLLMLPTRMPRWVDMVIGMLVGLVMDIFCNSLGIHMFACILLMFLRRPILQNLVMDYDRLTGEICIKTIGIEAYFRYTIALVLLHHTSLFLLSAWTLTHFWFTLLQIIVSSIVSIALLLGYDLIRKQ